MKLYFLAVLYLISASAVAQTPCKIAFDKIDDFDTTRIIAAEPITLGNFKVTGNLTEDLEGATYTEEAKIIISYADSEEKLRSFFLTLGTVERKFVVIDKGFNVLLKFVDGPVMELFNVPLEPEFDRDILMWKLMHTCVVPLEVFHLMKTSLVEKIRINYTDYKSTIILEPNQQIAIQTAVKCIEERLKKDPRFIKP